MRRRRLLLLLAGCAAVVLAFALAWPRDREPEYQGRKLSYWLSAYNTSYPGVLIYDSRVARAVRSAGTNALPFLLEWVRYEHPARKLRWLVQFDKLPPPLRIPVVREWLSGERRELRAN